MTRNKIILAVTAVAGVVGAGILISDHLWLQGYECGKASEGYKHQAELRREYQRGKDYAWSECRRLNLHK